MQKLHLTSGRAIALASLGFFGVAAFVGVGNHASAQQGASATSQASGSSRGKAVYDAHCVECHGQTGKVEGIFGFKDYGIN